jgi:hypothetical protein
MGPHAGGHRQHLVLLPAETSIDILNDMS